MLPPVAAFPGEVKPEEGGEDFRSSLVEFYGSHVIPALERFLRGAFSENEMVDFMLQLRQVWGPSYH